MDLRVAKVITGRSSFELQPVIVSLALEGGT